MADKNTCVFIWLSAGMYDDEMKCKACGFCYTESMDATSAENLKRSEHKCMNDEVQHHGV